PTAPSAISDGVIGRWGVCDGMWIAPVTAQLMITLPRFATIPAPSGASHILAHHRLPRSVVRIHDRPLPKAPAHSTFLVIHPSQGDLRKPGGKLVEDWWATRRDVARRGRGL